MFKSIGISCMNNRLFLALFLLITSTSLFSFDKPYDFYRAGLNDIKAKDLESYRSNQHLLQGHALAPLLKFHYLKKNIDLNYMVDVQKYINQNAKSPMATWLKRLWLEKLFKQNKYEEYIKVYSDVNKKIYHCKYIYSLYQLGNKNEVNREAQKLEANGKSMSQLCEQVYQLYVSKLNEAEPLVWHRFKLSLKKYNFKLATSLITLMNTEQAYKAIAILKIYKNRNLILNKKFLAQNDNVEVISYGLFRLARIQPAKAAKLLEYYLKRYQWTAEQKQRVNQAIALRYALRKNKSATVFYRKIIKRPMAKVYETYLFSSALYHQDWQLIKDTIENFPLDKQQQARYQYWHGRALFVLGDKIKARKQLGSLAKIRDYYGFLASFYLKQPIQLNKGTFKNSQNEIDAVNLLPGMIRAKTFYQHNKKHHARLELYYLMKHESEANKYIIAKEIAKWGWHSTSIRLSSKIEIKDDLKLRFPIKYKEFIKNHATIHKIPQPLIYAIIRQESLFTEAIKSHAGAVGLMQLMPATAKITSRQYKLPYKGAQSLSKAQVNLRLGIAHLNRLYKELKQHPLLIIASYNAGKKAVKRWMPKHDKAIPAEIWIEMVPYRETRKYLKHVVANYIIYQARLGLKPSLKDLFKPVRK